MLRSQHWGMLARVGVQIAKGAFDAWRQTGPSPEGENAQIKLYAVETLQIPDFVFRHPSATRATAFMATLLENKREDLLPSFARQVAEIQSQHPGAWIYVCAEA